MAMILDMESIPEAKFIFCEGIESYLHVSSHFDGRNVRCNRLILLSTTFWNLEYLNRAELI